MPVLSSPHSKGSSTETYCLYLTPRHALFLPDLKLFCMFCLAVTLKLGFFQKKKFSVDLDGPMSNLCERGLAVTESKMVQKRTKRPPQRGRSVAYPEVTTLVQVWLDLC